MSTPFVHTGILGRAYGYLIPVTSEDPSISAVESRTEDWGIHLYCGKDYIGSVDKTNYLSVHPSVRTIAVEPEYIHPSLPVRSIGSYIEEYKTWVKLGMVK